MHDAGVFSVASEGEGRVAAACRALVGPVGALLSRRLASDRALIIMPELDSLGPNRTIM
jgi:hypothetical protein